MPAPTSGPYGTTATVYDPTGSDTNPIADGWTVNFTGTGHSNWKRLSNLMAPSNEGAAAQAYRGGATYGISGLGCEFWCSLPAKGATNGHYLDLTAMLADPNLSTRDFYYLELTTASGADTWDIGGQKNGSGTGTLASGTQEITAADYVAFCVLPSGSDVLLEGWWWTGSAWSKIVNYTDTSSPITPDGYFALEATVNSAWRVATIFGGEITSDSVSTGQVFPGLTQAASESPHSDNNWTSPGNVTADDTSYASITSSTFDSPDQSYVLKAYSFDFSGVPDSATIDGIIVRCRSWYANGANSIDLMQLLDASRAKGGDNKASTPQALTTSQADYTFGGATDLWGLALTPAWLKDEDFGVAYGILATGANADTYCDWITVEAYYTPAAGPPFFRPAIRHLIGR